MIVATIDTHLGGLMRASRLTKLVTAISILLLAAPLIAACGDSGGSSSGGGNDTTGGVANTNLDTAKAEEAQISVANGGVAEVTSADGTVTTIAFPAGSVSQDTSVVVTPLVQPTTDKGAPLTPGVLVVQKGNEDQHLTLATPAIVTFTLKGKVPKKAAIVDFTDASTAQAISSNIAKQGKKTTVSALVSTFSPTTVDGNPEEWGDLAPLVSDHRWALDINDTSSRTVEGVELKLTCSGKLKSTALGGKFAFNGMQGPLTFDISASFDAGPVVGSLTSTKIDSDAKLDECWVQVANKKKGTFYVWGNGNVFVHGSATLIARATAPDMSLSEDFSGATTSAVKISVKTGGLPKEVGGSVPAIVKIYDGSGNWSFEATLTWVAKKL
jgi:hypothetical protein